MREIPWWVWALGAGLVLRASSSSAAEKQAEDPDPPEPDPQPAPKPAPGLSPLWPLPNSKRKWKRTSFGSPRPWGSSNPKGAHKAIDIRANEGDPVVAPTDGTIIGDTGWVGSNTRGVLFQSDGGPMLVFGAVAPGSYKKSGRVRRGELLARIGRYPHGSTMLHFEVYRVGTRKRVKWPWGTPQPPQLVDPHDYLLATVAS